MTTFCIAFYESYLSTAGGFSCNLDVLHGGLGLNTNMLQFLMIFFSTVNFTISCHKILGSRSAVTNNVDTDPQ
jgi:hypothetical protein